MIQSKELCKSFEDIQAVNSVSVEIRSGSTFGLLGTNGAGKSTLLRMLAGILKPDSGILTIDGQPVFANAEIRRRCCYISDDQYFFANTTPKELCSYYAAQFPTFDKDRFFQLLNTFELPAERRVSTFSKGMKKQLSIFLGIAANTDYLFCDETFDGLDPVIRQAVKSLLADAIASRNLTPVIASHNLRELEDICDHVGLLHKGGLLLSRDLEELRLGIHKLQAVFEQPLHQENFPGLEIISDKSSGRLQTLVIRGEEQEILSRIQQTQPIFMELLPLTLEEVFICETEVVGYDFPNLGL